MHDGAFPSAIFAAHRHCRFSTHELGHDSCSCSWQAPGEKILRFLSQAERAAGGAARARAEAKAAAYLRQQASGEVRVTAPPLHCQQPPDKQLRSSHHLQRLCWQTEHRTRLRSWQPNALACLQPLLGWLSQFRTNSCRLHLLAFSSQTFETPDTSPFGEVRPPWEEPPPEFGLVRSGNGDTRETQRPPPRP